MFSYSGQRAVLRTLPERKNLNLNFRIYLIAVEVNAHQKEIELFKLLQSVNCCSHWSRHNCRIIWSGCRTSNVATIDHNFRGKKNLESLPLKFLISFPIRNIFKLKSSIRYCGKRVFMNVSRITLLSVYGKVQLPTCNDLSIRWCKSKLNLIRN